MFRIKHLDPLKLPTKQIKRDQDSKFWFLDEWICRESNCAHWCVSVIIKTLFFLIQQGPPGAPGKNGLKVKKCYSIIQTDAVFFHSTPSMHDSSAGNVPVGLHRPGLPGMAPQAEESSFLAIIKGPKGSIVPTKIYFSTAELILKPPVQAPGFSLQWRLASCCRSKGGTTGGMVLRLGGCFMLEVSVSCFGKFLQYRYIMEDQGPV